MDWLIQPAARLAGELRVPGDKSISHRAAMLGAVAEGKTEVYGFLKGEDCLSTLACLRAMGVEIEEGAEGALTIHGRGLTGLKEPADVLDCGNSGTSMRLLLGLLAGQGGLFILTGDGSLRSRPMDRVTRPLAGMGVQVAGRDGGRLAPLALQGGQVRPFSYRSPVASAQVKSAVLLAGLYADGVTSVEEPYPSRDHTERMLEGFGAEVERRGNTALVRGRPRLHGQRVEVPGDISSAAFFLVAASTVPSGEVLLKGVGVNPTRSGLLDALRAMGADIREENPRLEGGEPVADLLVRPASLKATRVEGALIPRLIDEVPALAVAAALAGGTTEIRDASELRVKETDRIATLAAELRRFGAVVEELPDGMAVTGGRLRGARCSSHGDHRLAMALAVAGLAAEGETRIEGAECAAVSFPGFLDALNSLRA